MSQILGFPEHVDRSDDSDLHNFFSTSNRAEHMRALADRSAESMLRRLARGDQIDTLHEVVARVVEFEGVRETQLRIDGVCRYRRIEGPLESVRSKISPHI